MPDRGRVIRTSVIEAAARGAAWSAASSLLLVACADGAPVQNFGFGPGMATYGDPTEDSVGTFATVDDGASEATATAGDPTAGDASTGLDASSTGAGPQCGNGVLEEGEGCDETELGGQTCETQGFDAGTLACAADRCTLDTSGCVTFACGNGIVEGTEVCDGPDLGGQGCETQGFDAGTLACAATCDAFDTAGCFFDCAEQDLGSSVGSPVAMGTTVGEDEDLLQSCGLGGVDRVLRFTAPAAATYQFDTLGSSYDTVLSLHDTCGGPAVACNDDTGGLESQVSLAMVAGQEVLIAVSGYSGSTGAWVLNIVQL